MFPNGFCRVILFNGNIIEGNITPNMWLNGFCIIYIGKKNKIQMGWYKNNLKNGNVIVIDYPKIA